MILRATCLTPLLLLVASTGVGREPGSLRQLAERKGLVVGGMILNAGWKTDKQRSLVVAEFRAGTVGAYWKRTRPARNAFDWSVTDAVVEWADQHGLRVHLHPMLFPADSENPPWVLDSPASDAGEILREHITVAAARYRGVADVWDVVNEAVAPSAQGGYRDCWWLRAMGPSYVVNAFRLARRHAPNAILLYNEHDIELSSAYQTGKWVTTQEVLRKLHAEGLVDGLGWQLHTTPDEVLGDQFALDARMKWVREELGLMNFVTELDMPIGPGGHALQSQRAAYRAVAEVWIKHSGGGWLQTWGVSDRHSWRGAEKRPLLFDEHYAPKPAYRGLREALEAAPDKAPST